MRKDIKERELPCAEGPWTEGFTLVDLIKGFGMASLKIWHFLKHKWELVKWKKENVGLGWAYCNGPRSWVKRGGLVESWREAIGAYFSLKGLVQSFWLSRDARIPKMRMGIGLAHGFSFCVSGQVTPTKRNSSEAQPWNSELSFKGQEYRFLLPPTVEPGRGGEKHLP